MAFRFLRSPLGFLHATGKERSSLPPRLLEHFPSRRPERGQSRWPWPSLLDQIQTPWMGVLKSLYARRISFPYAVSPDAGLLLYSIVKNAQPIVVVETGTCIGVSTIWIAAALADFADEHARSPSARPVLHSFDHFRPVRDSAGNFSLGDVDRFMFVSQQIAAAGFENLVRLHKGDSSTTITSAASSLVSEVRQRGLANSRGVQLAFIDADHTIRGVWNDFLALEPLLDTGGLVILHDTFPFMSRWKGPRNLMNHVNERATGRYQVLDLYLSPANYGLGVLRRIS